MAESHEFPSVVKKRLEDKEDSTRWNMWRSAGLAGDGGSGNARQSAAQKPDSAEVAPPGAEIFVLLRVVADKNASMRTAPLLGAPTLEFCLSSSR